MKKVTVLFALLLLSSLFCSCGKKSYSTQYWDMFDTIVEVEGYFDSEEEFEEASSLVYATLSHYNSLLNAYEDSDLVNLKAVNESGGKTLEISKELYDFLVFLKETEAKTHGACSPSMGGVTAVWKSVIADESALLPEREVLEERASHTGFDKVFLEENPHRVTLLDPEVRIDAGAAAKGWAADRLKEVLLENGVENLLVNLGGNVVAIGSKEGDDWNIGIRDPDGGVFTTVAVQNASVVTSGVYERGREIDGVLYHHVISPETLYPANEFLSVTVISPCSAEADVLSTALLVLSYDAGEKLLKSYPNACAMWIDKDKNALYSDSFPR